MAKCNKEILRLDNLRYELMNLKKWIHGIRSEKRHQAQGPDKQALGDQLSLVPKNEDNLDYKQLVAPLPSYPIDYV